MTIVKLDQSSPKRNLRSVVITTVKRWLTTWQIWHIDKQYRALGKYADELIDTQIYTDYTRRKLLLRRGQLFAALLALGGR